MLKTFKFRLYPTKQQQRLLDQQLEDCRWLYSYLLAERRDAWEQRQESLRYQDQATGLPVLKVERPGLSGMQWQVLQNVALRTDPAFQAFFRRVKEYEQKPGYPRFRGKGRYDSITFPQVPVGCHLERDEKRLRIANVGRVKVLLHRPVEGTIKSATIRRSRTGKWYVRFSCDCVAPAPPPTGQQVGIDVGLKIFAAHATRGVIFNPRLFYVEEQAPATAQRRPSKAEQSTRERAQRRKIVARMYERIRWRRSDFNHQHSRRIVNQFDLIAVEDLSIHRMLRNQSLAKSIRDVAWNQFADRLSYKAVWASRRYVAVNPAYPCQHCSRCGNRRKISLAEHFLRRAGPCLEPWGERRRSSQCPRPCARMPLCTA
jgi:putative transposase